MAITVSTGDNPNIKKAGTLAGDATTINSGFTDGIVIYQLRKEVRIGREKNGLDIELYSTDSITKMPQVISVASAKLVIILPFREKYEVRVQRNGGAWSSWYQFKTRDKRYQTPDASTQLSDDSDSNSASKGKRTIIVTNSAKAVETKTSKGTKVVNSDKNYVGVTSVTKVAKGEQVINTIVEVKTAKGVKIDTTM